MTGYSVKRAGYSNQGWASFSEAVAQIALAHERGQTWEVMVRDREGARLPSAAEGQRLVAAAVKAIQSKEPR